MTTQALAIDMRAAQTSSLLYRNTGHDQAAGEPQHLDFPDSPVHKIFIDQGVSTNISGLGVLSLLVVTTASP